MITNFYNTTIVLKKVIFRSGTYDPAVQHSVFISISKNRSDTDFEYHGNILCGGFCQLLSESPNLKLLVLVAHNNPVQYSYRSDSDAIGAAFLAFVRDGITFIGGSTSLR